jgi:hypothetical protein
MFARLRSDGLITLQDRYVKFCNLKGVQALAHFRPVNLTRIPDHNQLLSEKSESRRVFKARGIR